MPVCEFYMEGKMTKRPFPLKGNRTDDLLELVYIDVCGPINIRAQGSYKYFVTVTYNHSRYGYVYLMYN